MPRLIPRLVSFLKRSPPESILTNVKPLAKRPRQRTLRPVPDLPPLQRRRSILTEDVNPILNRGLYVSRKLPAPRLLPVTRQDRGGGRVMNENERHVSASPYVRLLTSSIRQCMLTEMYMPADFLVRFTLACDVKEPNGSRANVYVLPDRIEHPKFQAPNSSPGRYVLCSKQAVEASISTGIFKRMHRSIVQHSLLIPQVSHLLRTRIHQELELLKERLEAAPTSYANHRMLRRLTRAEWKGIRESGRIADEGAIAIIVLPKVNPRNKDTCAGSTNLSDLPALPPPSFLISNGLQDSNPEPVLPPSLIPVYNGTSLFPSIHDRTNIYNALSKILAVERKSTWRKYLAEQSTKDRIAFSSLSTEAKMHDSDLETEANAVFPDKDQNQVKTSAAYLLRSTKETLFRADSVPLFIALWRLRIWEGQGWDGGMWGGWDIQKYCRIR